MPEKREKTIILMMINHVEKMLKLYASQLA